VAAGTLPDGTPVIISGGDDGTVRVWRLADGTPVGEPLTGHDGTVRAVAAGTLPDGTPVIISGGDDGTVRVWQPADGTPVGEPLSLPEAVDGIAVRGNIIVRRVMSSGAGEFLVPLRTACEVGFLLRLVPGVPGFRS
jgi:WD40 repeat protein